jgi:hypothetical protein
VGIAFNLSGKALTPKPSPQKVLAAKKKPIASKSGLREDYFLAAGHWCKIRNPYHNPQLSNPVPTEANLIPGSYSLNP